MTITHSMDFVVIGAGQVADVLTGHEPELVELTAQTYLAHHRGLTVNPPSQFLTFPERPRDRIIGLPASLTGRVDGIKWIASVPSNPHRGIPRASAVTILNDPNTGFPYACVESSLISMARTAASAALAARLLGSERRMPRLGVIGCGPIGTLIHRFLVRTGWEFDVVGVHDLWSARAENFADEVRGQKPGQDVRIHRSASTLVQASDLIVLATVATDPYLTDVRWFAHGPLVLHISLRDLGVAPILGASQNIVDDVDHCVRAGTSLHLAEQETQHRRFVSGTIGEVLERTLRPARSGTVVFSPFGLGVLDLAVAELVHTTLRDRGDLRPVPDFFGHDDAFVVGASATVGEDRRPTCR